MKWTEIMAERETTLKLTSKEDHALAQLISAVCNSGVVQQFVIAPDDVEAIGRINAALNSKR